MFVGIDVEVEISLELYHQTLRLIINDSESLVLWQSCFLVLTFNNCFQGCTFVFVCQVTRIV